MHIIQIRPATAVDSSTILQFVKELALYEKAAAKVTATTEDIKKSFFGPKSTAHALLCSIDETQIGLAVYFFNYSTWLGKNGLYLEDLYISPEYRGMGGGKALLKHLATIALDKGCGRLEWSVLHWNQHAIHFYESFGAKPQKEWLSYRLDGKELIEFAKKPA